MSNGTTIICYGAGEKLGTLTLEIEDHECVNWAVAFKEDGFRKYGVSHKQIKALKKRLYHFYEDWYQDIANLGIPLHEYDPHEDHPANLTQTPKKA